MATEMGIRLKKARKEAGLSRDALAEVLGTSKTSIMRWEQGGLIPAPAIPTIARLTRKPVDYFLLEDSELSETKIQTATKMAEILDLKDNEIDELKSKIKHLEEIIQGADNLDKAIEMLKEENKRVG